MAQRYTDPVALKRMGMVRCPECGELPYHHSEDSRFWVPRKCDLKPAGVRDRIRQYIIDGLNESKEGSYGTYGEPRRGT